MTILLFWKCLCHEHGNFIEWLFDCFCSSRSLVSGDTFDEALGFHPGVQIMIFIILSFLFCLLGILIINYFDNRKREKTCGMK